MSDQKRGSENKITNDETVHSRSLIQISAEDVIKSQTVIANGQHTSVSKPIDLNDATFFDEVKKSKLMVVDFWAPWCAPCRMVSPMLEQLAQEYSGKVSFGKLNVDENPLVPAHFQVQSIPTILIFRNGSVADGVAGAVPKALVESKIKSQLSSGTRSLPYG